MGDLPFHSGGVPMEGHNTSFVSKDSTALLKEIPPPAGQSPCSGGELDHTMDVTHKQCKNANSLMTEVDISDSISSGIKRGKRDDRNSSQYGGPKESSIYKSPVSFPSTLRLVSALKGGRERSGGASPTENRRVKWAPDVYDPPVTSVDHSVKSHQQRPRSRKDKDKQKQKQKQKRKSRRKRKDGKTGHDGVHNPPALQAHGLSSSPDDLGELDTEIPDYGISSGQEPSCGSGFFLRESTAASEQMHFAAAEAS